MPSRRKFILGSLLTIPMFSEITRAAENISKSFPKIIQPKATKPVVISTWNHGIAANETAIKILTDNGKSIDAVEQGVRITEADPEISSVGLGGFPDWEGNVTLDASIMDENSNAGSVAYLQHILHPISVARAVMDKTSHVMLVGDGALKFALKNGFEKTDLLTKEIKKKWEERRKKLGDNPDYLDPHDHDTIGMLALDNSDNLSGACTTSGTSMKLPGRVGDSPIIGAGLFVDNEVGAATATGTGELIIRISGSHTVVELMRQGRTPQEACEGAINRLKRKVKGFEDYQAAFIAINKYGETGAYSIKPGFDFALYKKGENKLIKSSSLLK